MTQAAVQVSGQDMVKAAEALSFSRFQDERVVRSVTRLPEAEATKLSSSLRIGSLSTKQAQVADRMGRELAHRKVAAGPKTNLLGLVTRPFTNLLKPLEHDKAVTGLKALHARFKANPGHTAIRAAQGLAIPGAALYGGYRMLRGSDDRA